MTRRSLQLLALYGLLVATAIGLDGVLHVLDLGWVGRWLGPVGTGIIVLSFGYSLRKRERIRTGSPQIWLKFHEALALLGALALLVHAGLHYHALLPWLALVAMLVAVASGLIGEFLLSRSRERLTERERGLRTSGLTDLEVGDRLAADTLTVRAMETWRIVHLPIALNFAVLSLLHIVTIIVFT